MAQVASSSNCDHGGFLMNIRRFTLGTAVSLVSLVAGGGACTITTTSSPGDDAGSVTPLPDAGADVATGDSATGTIGLGFTASNLGGALVGMDLSQLADIDVTGSGEQLEVDCASNPQCLVVPITEAGGGTVNAYVANSWKIEPNAVLNVTDKVPVIMVALTTIEILGHFNASASGFGALAGGYTGAAGVVGAGMGGGGVGTSSQVTPGVGGGGGSYCGAGGKGGAATATQGQAGSVYGSASLIPLLGGSAGGGGAEFGGGGGGAIEMVAGTSVDIGATGVVFAGGGGGSYGQEGSGGGSGGAVLVEAPQVTIEGTVAVNGGGGGGGTAQPADGADSTPNATAASGGILGTTGAGGNGSAGTTVAGTTGSPGDPPGNTAMYEAGGGGGGAGYIRINSRTGMASLVGTLSPSAVTPCVTQGTLAP
jgi:hypothetical protein